MALQVVTIVPKDKDAKLKYQSCEKQVKQMRFAKAIESEETQPVSQTIKLDDIGVCGTSWLPGRAWVSRMRVFHSGRLVAVLQGWGRGSNVNSGPHEKPVPASPGASGPRHNQRGAALCLNCAVVSDSYAGPRLEGDITKEFVLELMSHLKEQKSLHKKYPCARLLSWCVQTGVDAWTNWFPPFSDVGGSLRYSNGRDMCSVFDM